MNLRFHRWERAEERCGWECRPPEHAYERELAARSAERWPDRCVGGCGAFVGDKAVCELDVDPRSRLTLDAVWFGRGGRP